MEQKKHHTGLNSNDVLESRRRFGSNILSPPIRASLWKLFVQKFDSPIIRILLIAAFLSLIISVIQWEFAETAGIFFAIILATGIAFWFESDASKKFDILNKVNDDTLYKTFRNGQITEIAKKDIVAGDVVVLDTGEEVPADGELLESTALQVDESCLTGWSVPARKGTDPSAIDSGTAYGCNQLLRGTNIMNGHCTFIVTNVGDNTEFGKIAKKATEYSGEETPLNQQLDKLAKVIGVVGLAVAAITFITLFIKETLMNELSYTLPQLWLLISVITGLMTTLIKTWLPNVYDALELAGRPKSLPHAVEHGSWLRWVATGTGVSLLLIAGGWMVGIDPLKSSSWISIETAGRILQYFMVSVTLIVVAVPEGLPMSVTLSLALSMRKMLKANNLVRKMHACETMGATTVICTDKTGTLTQNQMKVSATNFAVTPNSLNIDNPICQLVVESLSVNSTAYIDFSTPEKPRPLGNYTEAALLIWLHELQYDYLSIREQVEIIDQLTFSAERKFMATVVYSKIQAKKILYVKGAPEIVLSRCTNILTNNGIEKKPEPWQQMEELLSDYQTRALRTIGFAYEFIDNEESGIAGDNITSKNLIFIGIAAISDPVRPDVPQAVKACCDAGIDVKIVTGDTPGTAREIGRQIGIWLPDDTDRCIITGEEFEKLNDEQAQARSKEIKIMCRAKPSDKQRLVQMLQRNGSVVAVTGDGTNDAPALNFAHVGLSMGSGTSVAKEASDITLTDDSFSSIANAVLWGRSVFRNIQRFIVFQLTINISALIIVFIGALFDGQLPLTVTQLLWVNLIMDTFAAGALASLPPDGGIMKEKPRDRNSFIVNKPMTTAIVGVGLLFVIILLALFYYFSVTDLFNTHETGTSIKELTMLFTIFVMLQFWNMFNAKALFSKRSAFQHLNKSTGFLIVAAIILMGQFLIVEFGGSVFRTVPLTLAEWTTIIIATSPVLLIGEIYRFWGSHLKPQHHSNRKN